MADDINVGAITEALNNKVDLPTGDSQDGIDYVIDWQKPSESNGYTWYRKYKSGWVEQGGSSDENGSHANEFVVTLPVEMANNRYTVVALSYSQNNSTGGYTNPGVRTKSTTSFQLNGIGSGTSKANNWDWQVSGQGA